MLTSSDANPPRCCFQSDAKAANRNDGLFGETQVEVA